MGARRLGVPATKKRPYFQSFMKVGQELEMPRPGEGEGREGRRAERRPPPQARGNLGPWELPNREPRGLRVSLGKSGVRHLWGHRSARKMLKAPHPRPVWGCGRSRL